MSMKTMKETRLRRWRGTRLIWLGMAAARCLAGDQLSDPTLDEYVARSGGGRAVTPVNQVVTPAGQTVDLPGLRPQALALSPDGRILVASGKIGRDHRGGSPIGEGSPARCTAGGGAGRAGGRFDAYLGTG
jgi:hypothetical protein